MKKNKKHKRKYIDELNIKYEDTPQGWCTDTTQRDPRRIIWHNERIEYGFDSRETWGLDYTIKLFLYERLCMYNEINIVNTSFHKFEYDGEKLTQQQCIDRMIEGLKLDLTLDDFDNKRQEKEIQNKISDVFPILSLCINALWW